MNYRVSIKVTPATSVDISAVRANFSMKFYKLLNNKKYSLSPNFVKIYLT